jgi:hypothetical protein
MQVKDIKRLELLHYGILLIVNTWKRVLKIVTGRGGYRSQIPQFLYKIVSC